MLEFCDSVPMSPARQPLPVAKPDQTSRIEYDITPMNKGVHLCIWETARTGDFRAQPFLYMVNYRLSSEDEAQKVVDDYLKNTA
jgi:hypothetical protein